jgi:hypothetical protein
MARKPYKRIKALTPERVRQFRGLENLSDSEANNIIDSLKRLSTVLYNSYIKSTQGANEEN